MDVLNREKDIFDELNRRLQEKGVDLTVICVGGFVLSHYGLRTTHDKTVFSRHLMRLPTS